MWESTLFSFLAGLFAANGIPHFVRGITQQTYPCIFGSSAVTNLIAGWGLFLIACAFAYYSHASDYPMLSFAAGALGVLAMGLFHAAGLVFGRT